MGLYHPSDPTNLHITCDQRCADIIGAAAPLFWYPHRIDGRDRRAIVEQIREALADITRALDAYEATLPPAPSGDTEAAVTAGLRRRPWPISD